MRLIVLLMCLAVIRPLVEHGLDSTSKFSYASTWRLHCYNKTKEGIRVAYIAIMGFFLGVNMACGYYIPRVTKYLARGMF